MTTLDNDDIEDTLCK